MAYAQPVVIPVVNADEDTRAQFITRVYQHIGLAVVVFIVFEYLLFTFGIAERMENIFFGGSGFAWIGLLLAVGLGSTIASQTAHNLNSKGLQYAGLFGEAALQAIIFAPFLFYIFQSDQDAKGTIGWSAVITLLGFGVLSIVAYTSRKDFSFLRPFIMWASIAAFVLIGGSLFLGFNLGMLFSVAMVALAGAMILYKTQQIVREYPSHAYVGASVALFASLMLMFWYVLRIVGSLRN